MKILQPRRSSERGAVLIHVAGALLGLLAFTVFVVDYGVMWVSRGQAQTSADAGALSGAVALAYEAEKVNVPKLAAIAVAKANYIFGQPPVVLREDVLLQNCPPDAPGLVDMCVRVNVYRNQARGNPLPIFFGTLIGVAGHGVQATATAQLYAVDKTDCLKPFAIPDKWSENRLPTGEFNRYDAAGGLLPTPDSYDKPTDVTAGTGYRIPNDLGLVTLKVGDPNGPIERGLLYPVQVDPTKAGEAEYSSNIANCNTRQIAPGTQLIPESDMAEPTKTGIKNLWELDKDANWVLDTSMVAGGCMAIGTCTRSPRLIAIAAFNPDSYAVTKKDGSPVITVTHVVGFWIDSINASGDVVGYFTHYPAMATAASTLIPSASFLRTVILVR